MLFCGRRRRGDRIVEWIISSCVLILVVTLLRFLLKGKISLRLQYALWALVLVRLLVPVSLGQSGFSVMNAVTVKQTEYYVWYTGDMGAAPAEPNSEGQAAVPPVITAALGVSLGPNMGAVPVNTTCIQLDRILRSIWIIGIAAAAMLFLFSNLRFTVRLQRSRKRVEHELTTLPVAEFTAYEEASDTYAVVQYNIDFEGERNIGTVSFTILLKKNGNGFLIRSKTTEFFS